MKRLLILVIVPLLSFVAIHKYYISVTQIDYLQNKQSVQITTRIFIDDLEKLLRERYDETITLASVNESNTTDLYIERYLNEKIKIKINNKEANLSFIGKEYDVDIVKCYLEIEGVKKIESFEISNEVLFDLFSDQQNIIKTKINSQQKSVILFRQNPSALLKFN
ncbi:hypothetical protein CJ739_793 [Mariniflexile rhizosphaerae]|uniref:DUF6702 family protein n=1 Tax=unclassified Mariniflexile TaxID=2643887 RepID=UPI000CB55D6B|nr:DUF6702 family protein [Mariniflexile sp. TRM1-10]AXP79889.1 hypothetical protein CJ739_793 [Mariniflexile sp. TRM1-10]PLB21106.1 MAG: hypothetical protein TRG1_199 [Flavobacteriaceae bacterium FS1-H7996/R]